MAATSRLYLPFQYVWSMQYATTRATMSRMRMRMVLRSVLRRSANLDAPNTTEQFRSSPSQTNCNSCRPLRGRRVGLILGTARVSPCSILLLSPRPIAGALVYLARLSATSRSRSSTFCAGLTHLQTSPRPAARAFLLKLLFIWSDSAHC